MSQTGEWLWPRQDEPSGNGGCGCGTIIIIILLWQILQAISQR